MPPIRVIFQSSPSDYQQRIEPLKQFAVETRREQGCLHIEDFQSIDFPVNLLHLEIWETPEDWDAHWTRLLKASVGRDWLCELMDIEPAKHEGAGPRRAGQDGIEFYTYAPYTNRNGVWTPAGEPRATSIRLPAWSKVRIVVHGNSDPRSDYERQRRNAASRREYPGCEQFEHFRGIEFPENTVQIESWSSPKVYDEFWQKLVNNALGDGPPGPPPIPAQRRYGWNGMEWYNLCYYDRVGDVWEPEDPLLRSSSVRW